MKVEIGIERDKQTLTRWNFKEEALVVYDEHCHVAIPISRVSGYVLRILIDEWLSPIQLLDEEAEEK